MFLIKRKTNKSKKKYKLTPYNKLSTKDLLWDCKYGKRKEAMRELKRRGVKNIPKSIFKTKKRK